MHYGHISAKIQSINLTQHFDWGGGAGTLGSPSGYALGFVLFSYHNCSKQWALFSCYSQW